MSVPDTRKSVRLAPVVRGSACPVGFFITDQVTLCAHSDRIQGPKLSGGRTACIYAPDQGRSTEMHVPVEPIDPV